MEASIFTTGSVYRLFRDQFSQYEKQKAEEQCIDPYELLNEQGAQSSIGSHGLIVIPHFAGAGAPHWNPYSRGIIAGFALGHTRNDLIHAIMEGICFEIKKNIEVMQSLKIPTKEMRITGGMTRCDMFNKMQADVYGIPTLRSVTEEATALGAAMLILKGMKIYKSYDEIAEKVVRISDINAPNPENHEKYNKILKISKKIYEVFQKNNLYKEIYDLGE